MIVVCPLEGALSGGQGWELDLGWLEAKVSVVRRTPVLAGSPPGQEEGAPALPCRSFRCRPGGARAGLCQTQYPELGATLGLGLPDLITRV